MSDKERDYDPATHGNKPEPALIPEKEVQVCPPSALGGINDMNRDSPLSDKGDKDNEQK